MNFNDETKVKDIALGRCEVQADERDVLEVLIFDEIEETVGTWLRAIIQRLEKEQTAFEEIATRSKPQAAKH